MNCDQTAAWYYDVQSVSVSAWVCLHLEHTTQEVSHVCRRMKFTAYLAYAFFLTAWVYPVRAPALTLLLMLDAQYTANALSAAQRSSHGQWRASVLRA